MPDETPIPATGPPAAPVKRRFHYPLLWLSLLAVVVGVVAAYGANGFRLAFGSLDEWLHTTGGLQDGYRQWAALALGGLVFGIVLAVLKWDGFRTPAHVIVAAGVGEGKLALKGGLVTAAVDALSLGLGAAVGRYGPALQLGATIGSQIGQLIGLNRTGLRVLLGCGVSGAIAASFNAPIAGAIFAHEVVIGHFRLRAFAPIAMASVAATAVTHFHGFDYIALKLSDSGADLGLADYPLFVLVGLVAAGVAMLYLWGITGLRWANQRLRVPVLVQPMLGGLVAGACGLALPRVLGLGDETVQRVLEQDPGAPEFAPGFLMVLLAGKVVASVACLGFRYPGGAFSPAIFAGAMLGGAVGFAAPFLEYQICVLVGMGAMMSSVVGAPIATILIVFELTENYRAATAVMVGVVAANGLVTRFFGRSLFHRQVRSWGIDLDRPGERAIMEKQVVADLMSRQFVAVSPEEPAAGLREMVGAGHRGDVFVVGTGGELMGRLPLAALASAGDEATARTLCEPAGRILAADDDLWEAFVGIEHFVGHSVPVVRDRESMVLAGVVYEGDFIRAYRAAVQKVREDG